MKPRLLSTLTLLITFGLMTPAHAENLQHMQQLMSTRECQSCDLSRAGLVFANLTGTNLSGANLSEANLTRANLSNANLSGADLRGAVLYNVNLSGADLSGANLSGVDLRDSYLEGVNLEGANLQGTNMMGAVGIPTNHITAEDYYVWGLAEDQRGNYNGAIAYFNQALTLKPDFAHAFLARGVSRLHLYNEAAALADGQRAEQLYLAQGDATGHQVAVRFTEGVQAYQEALANAEERRNGRGGGNFMNLLSGIATLALRFLLP